MWWCRKHAQCAVLWYKQGSPLSRHGLEGVLFYIIFFSNSKINILFILTFLVVIFAQRPRRRLTSDRFNLGLNKTTPRCPYVIPARALCADDVNILSIT